MKRIYQIQLSVFLLLFVLAGSAFAQIKNPTKWQFSSKNLSNGEVELVMKATIEDGWHLYSQFIDEGGPVPTSFSFDKSNDYTLSGKVLEKSKVIKDHDKAFDMDIAFFLREAVFVQKIKVKKSDLTVTGRVNFMLCNDQECLAPTDVEFKIAVKGAALAAATENTELKDKAAETEVAAVQVNDAKSDTLTDEVQNADSSVVVAEQTVAVDSDNMELHDISKGNYTLWTIFFLGFLGGLAAFFMPCIFPMVPFTVSFFMKSSAKGGGVGKALIYGLSIVLIYVGIGLLVSVIFGADALNNLSTNGVFNLFFFLLLVVFAASFLGAFELTLPSKWVNKSDEKSSNSKGLLGIFFMATTLALVSFSCTGPIIGYLLVQAATMGQYMGPTVGMLGFAIALALPFTLFAMFPALLKNMPKSGGWLNSIKVTLGFLELALALKFLSNVDLAYHWNWFDREVFLVLWIVIFGLLGIYLLGKLRFAHDSEVKTISVFRLFLAIISLSFTMYMIPGLWGAPLKSISAFLPPQQSQDFDLYTSSLSGGVVATHNTTGETRKYSDLFHAPYGINAFFDYEEGLKYAQENNKPVMIDFTGHACVNCRKMEADVWSNPNVLDIIKNKYVLIQLYVDDKTELPEDEQYVSTFSGKKIKTIGNKWSDLQAMKYNSNSQPFYVLLDNNGQMLVNPQGADYNADNFSLYLNSGLDKLNK